MGPKGKGRGHGGEAVNSETGLPLQCNPPIRSLRGVFVGLFSISVFYFFLRFLRIVFGNLEGFFDD